MTSSDDGGYVHDPSSFDDEDERREADDDNGYVHDPSSFDEDERREASDDADWIDAPAHPETADREFDWRGWTLVAVIVFAFIIAPGIILFWPPATDHLFALIVLPLIPAVLLAVTAVWATTRP